MVQKTEVSEVLVMVAEKVSVLPRRTVTELGAIVTVICGVGGVVELPPGPLAQAVRERAKARRKTVHAGRRWMRGLRVEGLALSAFVREGAWYLRLQTKGQRKNGCHGSRGRASVENLFPLKCVKRRAWSL